MNVFPPDKQRSEYCDLCLSRRVAIHGGDCGAVGVILIFNKEGGLPRRDRFIACSNAQKASEAVILGA